VIFELTVIQEGAAISENCEKEENGDPEFIDLNKTETMLGDEAVIYMFWMLAAGENLFSWLNC
jgi:hypothetical protein